MSHSFYKTLFTNILLLLYNYAVYHIPNYALLYYQMHLAILQHLISIHNISENQSDMFSVSSLSSIINGGGRGLNYLDNAIKGN